MRQLLESAGRCSNARDTATQKAHIACSCEDLVPSTSEGAWERNGGSAVIHWLLSCHRVGTEAQALAPRRGVEGFRPEALRSGPYAARGLTACQQLRYDMLHFAARLPRVSRDGLSGDPGPSTSTVILQHTRESTQLGMLAFLLRVPADVYVKLKAGSSVQHSPI